MLKQTTALASLAILFSATTVMAEMNETQNIRDLKAGSAVSISGTVSDVDNDNEFTISDSMGDTIEVESNQVIALQKGDRVAVSGELDSKFMGLSKEIDATSVRVIGNESASNAASSDNAAAHNYTNSTNLAMNDATNSSATTRNSASSAAANRNSALTANRASTDSMTNTASAGMAGMGTANTANTMSTSDTSADRASSNQWQNDDRGAVETLAESGNVSLKGTISSIDKEDKELTLRDSKGNTIDVHSTAALDNLREGDKVSVRGEVRDEMAGMGKEIVNARVMEIRQ